MYLFVNKRVDCYKMYKPVFKKVHTYVHVYTYIVSEFPGT